MAGGECLAFVAWKGIAHDGLDIGLGSQGYIESVQHAAMLASQCLALSAMISSFIALYNDHQLLYASCSLDPFPLLWTETSEGDAIESPS